MQCCVEKKQVKLNNNAVFPSIFAILLIITINSNTYDITIIAKPFFYNFSENNCSQHFVTPGRDAASRIVAYYGGEMVGCSNCKARYSG